MTTTAATITVADKLLDLADTLGKSDLPAPRVTISWHRCDDDTVRAIVAAFPDVTWTAGQGVVAEWLTAEDGSLDIAIFAKRDEPTSAAPRIAALLPEVTR